jgi:hypothetical protein
MTTDPAAAAPGDDLSALLAEWGGQAERDLERSAGEGEYISLRRLIACIAALERVLKLADGRAEAITAALAGLEGGDA